MITRATLALLGLLLTTPYLPLASAANLNFTYRGPAGYMNEADWEMFRAEAAKMLNDGEDGVTYTWTNQDTGTSGSFTPEETTEENGQPCRIVTVTLEAGPAEGRQVMTVCKQPEGDWRIVR